MIRFFILSVLLLFISCTSGLEYTDPGSKVSVKIESLPSDGSLNKAWVFVEHNNYIHHYKEDFSTIGNTIFLDNNLDNYNLIVFIPSATEGWSYNGDDNLDGEGWYASKTGLSGANSAYKVTDWSNLTEYGYNSCGTLLRVNEDDENSDIDNAKEMIGSSFISIGEMEDSQKLYYKLPIESGYTYYLYLEDKNSNPNVLGAKVRGTIINYFETQIIDEYVTSDPMGGIVSIENSTHEEIYLRVESLDGIDGEFKVRMRRKLSYGENLPPNFNFIYPSNGNTYTIGEPVNIAVNSWDYDGDVSLVKYFVNDTFIGSSSSYPFSFTWDSSNQDEGVYVISAIAEDNFSAFSDEIEISIAIGQQIFFYEDFESGSLTDWSVEDEDGDGENWEIFGNVSGYNSSTAVTSHSYINGYGAVTPDNYLITKKINILAGSTLEYYICNQDITQPGEQYSVLISTTDDNPSSFTQIYEETLNSKEQGEWKKRTLSIDYEGEIYIAFRHYNSTDLFAITLDNVKVFKN